MTYIPRNAPAKSMYRYCHGCVGQVHGWRAVSAGLFLKQWQDSHFWIISSICFSTPGRHMQNLTKGLIFTIPVWPIWRSSVLSPAVYKWQWLIHQTLLLCLIYVWRMGITAFTSCGHPSLVYLCTLDKIGSFDFSKHNCFRSTRSVPTCWILNKHAESSISAVNTYAV